MTAEAQGNAATGRDLDALVAERLMGWVWMSRGSWLFPPDSEDRDTGDKGFFGEPVITRDYIVGPFQKYDGGRKEFNSMIPEYSTNMESAMEVAEKMRERGFRWNAQTPHGKGWQIQCYKSEESKGKVFRGLLPEAICRAALAAAAAEAE